MGSVGFPGSLAGSGRCTHGAGMPITDSETQHDAARHNNDKQEASGASGDTANDKAEQETRRKRRPLVIAIGVIIVVLLAGGGLYYWIANRNLESTDDAYTDGRAITIAPQVSGQSWFRSTSMTTSSSRRTSR